MAKLYHCARCGREQQLPRWRRPLHVEGWWCPPCAAVFRATFTRPMSTLRMMTLGSAAAAATGLAIAALHAPAIAIAVAAWAAFVAAVTAVGERARRQFLAAERGALPAATLRPPPS